MYFCVDHFDPGHYIAIDRNSYSIIIAIRGTSHMRDVITDLTGRNEPFQVTKLSP